MKVPRGPRKPTRGWPPPLADGAGRGHTGRIVTCRKPTSGSCWTACGAARSRPTTPCAACAACRSPISASPGSTTTGPCARAWPRRLRPGQDARAVRRHRHRRCGPTVAPARSCSPGPSPTQAAAALAAQPDGATHPGQPATIVWDAAAERPERVALVTAGTADGPVARRVRRRPRRPTAWPRSRSPTSACPGSTACWPRSTSLAEADALVVVAGMEGALPSVVAGLTAAPVVAVPTSVGLRRRARRGHRAAGHAGVLRARRDRGRHRQRLRRGLRRGPPPRRSAPAGDDLAWFHCFSGIAGDMALGALVDAGADLDEVRNLCERLPVGGWALEAEPVLRCGIAATKVHVHAEETTVVRTAAHITGLIEEARLPDRVRDRALATFDGLAEAEGTLHRRPPSQVHFHEVGSPRRHHRHRRHVRGPARARRRGGPRQLGGHGHGHAPGRPRPAARRLPRPSSSCSRGRPATASTSRSRRPRPRAPRSWPPRSSAGATCRRWSCGPAASAPAPASSTTGPTSPRSCWATRSKAEPAGQPVVLLETNVDDATGEVVADAVAALLDAGAHDAWVTNILMKKGRPAHQVSALVDPSLVASGHGRHDRVDRQPRRAGHDARALAPGPGAERGRGRRPPGAGQGQRRAGQGRARRRVPGRPAGRAAGARGHLPGRGGLAPRGEVPEASRPDRRPATRSRAEPSGTSTRARAGVGPRRGRSRRRRRGPSRGCGSSGTRGRGRPSRRPTSSSWKRGRWRNGTPMSTWWARCQPVLNGTIQKRAGQVCSDVVGGLPAVGGADHAAVLGDGPQPVDDPPARHPRGEPQQRVELGPADGGEAGQDHDLGAEDAQGDAPGALVLQAAEQALQVLPAGDAEGVAAQLADAASPG